MLFPASTSTSSRVSGVCIHAMVFCLLMYGANEYYRHYIYYCNCNCSSSVLGLIYLINRKQKFTEGTIPRRYGNQACNKLCGKAAMVMAIELTTAVNDVEKLRALASCNRLSLQLFDELISLLVVSKERFHDFHHFL